VIRWLRLKNNSAHAFRDGRTTSLCGVATLEGPWKRSPHTVRCVSCLKKAEPQKGGLATFARSVESDGRHVPVAKKFNGLTGRTPQAEAKRYVYAVLETMLDHELTDREGWLFGGIEHEDDKRRLRYAIELIKVEMVRKSKS